VDIGTRRHSCRACHNEDYFGQKIGSLELETSGDRAATGGCILHLSGKITKRFSSGLGSRLNEEKVMYVQTRPLLRVCKNKVSTNFDELDRL